MLSIRKISLIKLSLFLGAFLWLFSTVRLASAHGVEVLKSTPADGAVLTQAPAQVKVWFSEELQTGESSLQVLSANGARIDLGNGGVDLDDPEHASLKVDLASLPEGAYLVKWHAVLTDGDASDGELRFSVGQAGSAGSSYPAPASYPAPVVSSQKVSAYPMSSAAGVVPAQTSPANRWLVPGLVVGGLVVLGLLGLGMLYLRSKNTSRLHG